jgi:putative oxidoreductase
MLSSAGRSRGLTIPLWTAQVLLALFFVVAAMPKLIGTRQAVEQVAMLGFGDWFRYLIGICELAGAIGLLIPRLAGLAAAGLAVVMFLATLADVFVLPNPPALPAFLFAACALLAWIRRAEIRDLLKPIRR